VSLEHLWAGWRSDYVSGASDAARGGGSAQAAGPAGVRVDPPVGPSGQDASGQDASGQDASDGVEHCVFCRIAASGPPSVDNGVLWVGESVLVVLNAYPYASGHLMAIPRRHVRSLADLDPAESTALWEAARTGVAALEAAYRPEGVNLGANLGEAAGAGIPRHLHLHAVPRWKGDTNFMTAVADTRVLPETLASSWARLVAVWPGASDGAVAADPYRGTRVGSPDARRTT